MPIELGVAMALVVLQCCFLWVIYEQKKQIIALLSCQGQNLDEMAITHVGLNELMVSLSPKTHAIYRRRKHKEKVKVGADIHTHQPEGDIQLHHA